MSGAVPHPFGHPFRQPFDRDGFETRIRSLGNRDAYRFPSGAVPAEFKRSSVLILFWPHAADLRVLFTKRAATLRGHPGQMSFPGGRLEPGEDWIEAALRETEEEVGIPADRVEVLGRLDDAWSGAGHLLVPVVGWLEGEPTCHLNPAEVESVHTPSVAGFFAPEAYTCEEADLGGDIYYNSTLHWEGGSVFGLSTDLLIEAIQWGIGIEDAHGPGRLESLESYLRYKQAEFASPE